MDYDVIVCRGEAVDGETGQVPYGLAQRIGLLCIGNVVNIDTVNKDEIQVQYQEDDFVYTVSAKLPLVLANGDFTMKTGRVNLLKLKRALASGITMWNATDIDSLLERDDMNPTFLTEDSKIRRQLYQNDIIRNKVQEEFSGTQEEFLETLQMVMTVEPAKESDLQRAEELTVRTH